MHARVHTHAHKHARAHTHTQIQAHTNLGFEILADLLLPWFFRHRAASRRACLCVYVCVILFFAALVRVSTHVYCGACTCQYARMTARTERCHSRRVLFLAVTCPMDARAVTTTRVAAALSDKLAT